MWRYDHCLWYYCANFAWSVSSRSPFCNDIHLLPTEFPLANSLSYFIITAGQGAVRQHIATPAQPSPKQWSKYLGNSENKQELLEFFHQQWQLPAFLGRIPPGKILFSTSTTRCVKITSESVEVCKELESTHEEADTQLLLHAQHASDCGFANVTIKSPDTNVAIIMCALSSSIPATLLFLTDTCINRRLLNITAAAERLGEEVCAALPGMHAFSGCDSTSAFAHRGKKAAFWPASEVSICLPCYDSSWAIV